MIGQNSCMWNRNLSRWIGLFASLLWLSFGIARAPVAIKHNIANLLIARALVSSSVESDVPPLLIGKYRLQEGSLLDKAMALWVDRPAHSGSYLRALDLYAQGDYVAVVTEMQRKPIEALSPVEALLLGQAWYALGDTASAGTIWRQTGADMPMRILADRYFRAGEFEKALSMYLRLEIIWPQDGEIQEKLGDTYRVLGDFGHALMAYRRAAALGQDADRMQLLIIITELAATRDTAAARTRLEAILSRADLAPENRITALRVMYNIYRYYLHDFARAEPYLLTAIELPREDGDIWEELQLAEGYLKERRDCNAARYWITSAEGRYREGVSPLAKLQQLRQEIADLCDSK
jgi:tetratricopeptide (TPR) repeat protein